MHTFYQPCCTEDAYKKLVANIGDPFSKIDSSDGSEIDNDSNSLPLEIIHSSDQSCTTKPLINVTHVFASDIDNSERLVAALQIFLNTHCKCYKNSNFKEIDSPLTYEKCTKVFSFINYFFDKISINQDFPSDKIHWIINSINKNLVFEISGFAFQVLQKYAEALRLRDKGYKIIVDNDPEEVTNSKPTSLMIQSTNQCPNSSQK